MCDGLVLLCVATSCGHGGHTLHLAEWFVVEDECPTGCGCRCVVRGNEFYRETQSFPDVDGIVPNNGSRTPGTVSLIADHSGTVCPILP